MLGHRTPYLVLAGCVLLSFGSGLWRGWETVPTDPTAPPDVCRLVRPQTFDVLVPGHGPLEASTYEESDQRHSMCDTTGVSPVDGSKIELRVALTHYGRLDGAGPSCVERGGVWLPAASYLIGVLPLGDGAGYFVGRDGTGKHDIYLTICLGTYRAFVRYDASGVSAPTIIESTTTVGLEVLSRRRSTALFPPRQHWPVIVGAVP